METALPVLPVLPELLALPQMPVVLLDAEIRRFEQFLQLDDLGPFPSGTRHQRLSLGDMGVVDRVAVDLAPDEFETVRWLGLAGGHFASLCQTKPTKCLLTKTDFTWRQQSLVINDGEGGEDRCLTVADLDLAHRLKLLGREITAAPQQKRSVLGVGVDGNAPDLHLFAYLDPPSPRWTRR